MSNAFLPTLRSRLASPFSPSDESETGGESVYSAPSTGNSGTESAFKPSLARSGSPSENEAFSPSTPPYAQYLSDLKDVSGKLMAAYQAPQPGGFRQVLGALFSRKNPQLGAVISGQAQREKTIQPLQQEYGLLENALSSGIAQQKNLSEIYRNRFIPSRNGVYDLGTNAMVPGSGATQTPDEQAMADLLKQTNPDTQKPYTPYEARIKVAQALQDTKPGPTVKNNPGLTYDAGIPVSYKDKDGNVFDVNDPNLPPEGKALVATANKAHGQHVKEAADASAAASARALANQKEMNDERQNNLTSSTKTMIETAPKVLNLINRLEPLADKEAQGNGPLGARWSDFWNNKVGAPSQEYSKMRVDDGLLATALMRMHVGARGGELMMQHFTNLLGLAHQSPENYKAALDEIKQYANDVKNEKPGTGGGQTAEPSSATPPLNIIRDPKTNRIIGIQ